MTDEECVDDEKTVDAVLPQNLPSERMRKAADFRNILVHRYGEEIENENVYEHLQTELVWIVSYLREVRDVLNTS